MPVELRLFRDQKGVQTKEGEYILMGGVKGWEDKSSRIRLKVDMEYEIRRDVFLFNSNFILRNQLVK